MNIDYIKTFISVFRAGSFAEVAKEQNIAPSSVSRSIATLEATLNTRLFQRTTRSLTPTVAGESYFQKIEPLMEEMNLIHQSLIDATTIPSGRLRVSASVSYGQIVIAPKLAEFRQQYPDVELELLLSDRRVDLINDQIDLAIRHGSLPDSSLVARRLAHVQYRLVSSEKYLEQNSLPRKPQDLEQHDLVTFTYDDFRHGWRFESKDEKQSIAIQPVLTVTNAAVIRQSVREGLGIALLADWVVEKDLQSGKLVEVLPQWRASGASPNPTIWLVYPSVRFTPAKTKLFSDFLLQS